MLLLRRRITLPSLGALLATEDAMHARFRARLVRTDGLCTDERLFYPSQPWTGHAQRSCLVLVVRGRLHLSGGGGSMDGSRLRSCWLSPGDYAAGGTVGDLYTRVEAGSLGLRLEWDDGWLVGRTSPTLASGSLSLLALRRVQTLLARPSESMWGDEPARTLTAVLDVLRAEGLPFECASIGDVTDPAALALHSTAEAVSRCLTRLHDAPMTIDLETELSASRRTVARRLGLLATVYGTNGVGLRELRGRWRIVAASALATAEGITTEDAARACGFGSAGALCHAFARAGLPSPAHIADAVRALR